MGLGPLAGTGETPAALPALFSLPHQGGHEGVGDGHAADSVGFPGRLLARVDAE